MASSTIWAPIGDKGPTGDPGPQGPVGPQGPQGAPGPDAAEFAAFKAALQADGGDTLVGHIAGATAQQKFTQLDGQIAALQSGGSGQVSIVANISGLKALLKTGLVFAMTKGYHSVGDNGAGCYYLDLADTTSTDNGGTVIVATDGGRWKLLHNSSVNIEQFGAKPDGITNCVSAFNTMLVTASIKEILLGAGPYLFTGNTGVITNKTVRGISGMNSTVLMVGAGTWILRGMSWVSGITFDCSSQSAGSYVFLLNTAPGSFEYVTVEDIKTISAKGFMYDDASANIATNVRIRNISCRLHKGHGFYLTDVFAFLEMRDNVIDYIGNVTAQNYVGFTIVNNEGSYLVNCEVEGLTGIVAGTTAAQIGFNFGSCKATYMERCFTDNCGGRGIVFSSCQYVRMNLCSTSLNDDAGLAILSSSDVQITNIYSGGRKGMSGATAGIPAIFINASTRVSINGINANNATGDGINTAASSTQIQLSNGVCSNNSGRGITTNAGSIALINNLLFAGNSVQNYSIATANDHITGCQSNSGALLNVTGPASA